MTPGTLCYYDVTASLFFLLTVREMGTDGWWYSNHITYNWWFDYANYYESTPFHVDIHL